MFIAHAQSISHLAEPCGYEPRYQYPRIRSQSIAINVDSMSNYVHTECVPISSHLINFSPPRPIPRRNPLHSQRDTLNGTYRVTYVSSLPALDILP
nr:hypothetical protein CFP56_66114 [Quercus suber]